MAVALDSMLRWAACLAIVASTGCREPWTAAAGGDESGDDGGDGGDDGGADGEELPPRDPGPEFAPAPPQMRLLLARQYRNAIDDLLVPGAGDALVPPDDLPVSGQASVGASQVVLTGFAVEQYEEAALAAVNFFFTADLAAIDQVLGCVPVDNDDVQCAAQYIERFGRRAFRRPLTDDERTTYAELHVDGRAELDSFYGGVFLVLASMLQSPSFLYLTELGEDEEDPELPGARRLTGWELAAKLSFFLLGTTPDDALLDRAAAGDLRTEADVREVAEQMLADPRSRASLDAYFVELLDLEALDSLVKVPSAFPDLGSDIDEAVALIPEFGPTARRETLALIDDLVWDRDADFLEVLTAQYTFANPLLEVFYFGSPPAPDADLDAFARVETPPEQDRSGLLTHIGMLSRLARPDRTSPTLRGEFIREVILCDTIPPPPDDVEFMLPDDAEAPTLREKLEVHQDNEACAGCHIPLDNLGFALEHFDGLGFYRTTENGAPIDASADLPDLGQFDGARELGAVLRESPKVPRCLTKKLFRHAVGHVESASERPELDALVEGFVDDEHRLAGLLVEITASPAFRYVSAEGDE